MARVKAEDLRVADPNDITGKAKQYAFLKAQIDYLEKQQKDLRADLIEAIEESGVVDDKGNVILDLPEEVDGYIAVMKQRRVTRKINEEIAFELIEQKGLRDKLIITKEVVDEDALMAAMWNDELTEDEVDAMYPQNVVWALVMNKR
jgi:hypothetical protein